MTAASGLNKGCCHRTVVSQETTSTECFLLRQDAECTDSSRGMSQPAKQVIKVSTDCVLLASSQR